MHRLPNRWNALLAGSAITLHATTAIATTSWTPLAASARSGVIGLMGMWVLSLLVRGGLGLGDVKLVGALGCALANPWLVLGSVVIAFVAAALWVLPQFGRRYRGGSRIAFGPFLLLGAWGVLLLV